MSELSRYLMVSNGNVTGIIDRLEAGRPGGPRPFRMKSDRRASIVRLDARRASHGI